MIQLGEYKTKNGTPVIISEIKEFNSCGERLTFPVKGNYFTKTKSGRLQSHYSIWTLEGKRSVFGDSLLDIQIGE